MAEQRVTIKVGLAGAAATRREANSTGKSVKGIGTAAEHTAKKTRLANLSMKSMEGTTKRLTKGVGLFLGAAGIGGLAAGVKGLVVAASDAQASEVKVKKTIDNLGISYGRHKKRIDAVIQAQSVLSGLDDEALAESFAGLARTTGSVNKALKLNALAADIARDKGTSLTSAQTLLARAYNGNFKGLARLGIAITPITVAQDALRASGKKYTYQQMQRAKADDKAATSVQAIAITQRKFGGAAAAYGKTAKGSYDRFQVALENVKESLGMGLLPTLTKVANKTATFLTQLTTGEGAGGRFAKRMKGIKDALTPLGEWISKHRSGLGKLAAAFAGIALSLKAIKKIGSLTGLSKAASTVARSPLGRALGVATKADGTIKRPFYVVVLDKAPGSGKIVNAAKKVAAPVAGAAARFGVANALGLGASALVAGGGIAYLAGTHNLNLPTKGKGASSPSNPAGHVPFDPGALNRRVITPVNPAALRTAPAPVPYAGQVVQAGGTASPFVIHSHLNVDGKELAHAVTRAANKKKSLK